MRVVFRKSYLSLFLLLATQTIKSQLSKQHYIPPIAAHNASSSNAYPLDQHIYISTPSNNNTSAQIELVDSCETAKVETS